MKLPKKEYKWASPHEWLTQAGIDRSVLMDLIETHIDTDEIQAFFQTSMDEDGYFTPTNIGDFVRLLDRDQIVQFYDDHGEYGMGDEELYSYEDLVEELADDLEDGTYSFDELEELLENARTEA